MGDFGACLTVVEQHCSTTVRSFRGCIMKATRSARCAGTSRLLEGAGLLVPLGGAARERCEEYTRLSEELKAEIADYAADFEKKRSNGD